VKTTTGMGGGLSDTGEFSSASPSVCTTVVEDPFASVCAAKPNLRVEVSVCDLTPCLMGGMDSDSKGFEFPSLGTDALGEVSFVSSGDGGQWGSHLPVRNKISHEVSTEIQGKSE
jgi:hypothetical protein